MVHLFSLYHGPCPCPLRLWCFHSGSAFPVPGLAGHCAFLAGLLLLLLPCLHQIFFPEVLLLALLCFRRALILAGAVEKAVFGIFRGVI